jgi:decaprenyl-phosphate phosphoribosyltransferase
MIEGRESGKIEPMRARATSPVSRGRALSRAHVSALLTTARPRQWLKNVLVFAAPVASFAVGQPVTFGRTFAAAGAFCLASSGTYFVNDAVDAESDRRHPLKRFRPMAKGELSRSTGFIGGGVLALLGLLVALATSGPLLAGVVLGYEVISWSYSLALKNIPVLELLCISAGFVLRAVAGGVAANIPLSVWFLLVSCSAALFVACGKRTAELLTLGADSTSHRRALGWYRVGFLDYLRRSSLLVAGGAYILWAIARSTSLRAHGGHGSFILLSIIPFVSALLLAERALQRGEGGQPEELAFHNWPLQLCAGAYALLFVLAFLT